MARGSENQPKHFSGGGDCLIVLYEQSSHPDESRNNDAGYHEGQMSGETWQSHHILCLSTTGDREAKDDATKILLEESLWVTDWNINKEPNMIGLPMYRLYVAKLGAIDRKPKKNRPAAFAAVVPQGLPAHDVDHNTKKGYTQEVKKHLQSNVWKKFDSQGNDHKKDAEWLANELKQASKDFQETLVDRATRNGGIVKCWQDRFEDKDRWAEPFSMAETPSKRHPGVNYKDLSRIFKKL